MGKSPYLWRDLADYPEASMADESPKRPANAKPISLYPMTLEDIIRRAVNTPPPLSPENARPRRKAVTTKRRPQKAAKK
jgi:hypothetical protein